MSINRYVFQALFEAKLLHFNTLDLPKICSIIRTWLKYTKFDFLNFIFIFIALSLKILLITQCEVEEYFRLSTFQ